MYQIFNSSYVLALMILAKLNLVPHSSRDNIAENYHATAMKCY